jgi:polyphosphate:AMP phosphotransferase
MFEAAELGRNVSREEYKEREVSLRVELLQAQQALRDADFPVILVFAGVDGAGKGETVNLLSEWMDPRWLITHAYEAPSQEETERPEFWRYWRDLPGKGRIGMFLSSWYSKPVLDRVYGNISVPDFDEKLDRILAFEKALTDDGALILKFWMHLGKEAQKKRLKTLEKDPLLSWRVTETDWHNWRLYDGFVASAERTIMRTSTGEAPWHIVEGYDPRYRSLTVGVLVRDAIRKHLADCAARREVEAQLQRERQKRAPKTAEKAQAKAPDEMEVTVASMPTVLSRLDMSQSLTRKQYKEQLKKYQARLNLLHRKALARGVSTLMVFEGADAAGKGGAIRRCTPAFDARRYQVIPFAAPTDEERAHHYMWRFWRHLGRAGRVMIFDRSWYGRVLVERVEGFATEDEWMRAYAEINDFEAQLVEHGIVLLKYWLHITPEEQLARFKARQETPWKQWKLTDEDWRNRQKWAEYEMAVHDMVERTSTSIVPWTLVEGNDKLFARVKVIKTLVERLESALKKSNDSRSAAA